MGLFMMVNLLVMKLMVSEPINGVMAKLTQVNGGQIKCMVKAYYNGQMEDHIKENFKMTKDMGLVNSHGMMEGNTLESGLLGSSMV